MSEKIKNILMEHRGRKNATTAKRISKAMGFLWRTRSRLVDKLSGKLQKSMVCH